MVLFVRHRTNKTITAVLSPNIPPIAMSAVAATASAGQRGLTSGDVADGHRLVDLVDGDDLVILRPRFHYK